MTGDAEQLLERLRARRQLPAPAVRRQIREQAGASLRDLAAALGVSHTAVADWERGTTPRGRQRVAYAALLEELARIAA